MSLNSRRIEPLPPEVVTKLKSSTSITHLNGVIVELVKNALDANASTVSVTVDFGRGGCKVEDNGDGIQPTEFEPGGGLGRAHHTSKYHSSSDVYGQKGLFLASLSSLSLLTITSHHVRHPSTNTIMFHHSTPVVRLIPAPAQQELSLSSHGTTVTVNDLFGNMPVRVKNRALALQKHDELDRQWDELRQLLVSLMVANDSLAKLIVTEAAKDKKFILRPRTRVRRTDEELDLQRIGSIFAQAGLIEFQNADNWDAVSASVPDFSVRAAISLVPSPTKKVQFISVGKDPVFPRSSVNLFYAEVNRLFTLSDFSTIGTASNTPGTSSADHLDRYDAPNTKPTTKAVNKWPMFYIRLDTNEPHKINSEGQELPESDKSVQRIMDVLTAMIQEFLKQHSLRPRTGKRRQKMARKQAIGGTSSKSDSVPCRLDKMSNNEEALGDQLKLPNFQKSAPYITHGFGEWSKIKSAQESFHARFTKPRINSTCIGSAHPSDQENLPMGPEQAEHRMIEEAQRLLTYGNSMAPGCKDDSERDTMIPWIDPFTGRSHLVNSRTGQSVDVKSSMDDVQRPKSTGPPQTMRRFDIITRPRSAIQGRTQNIWVEKLMDKWENPVFSRSEKPINAISACHGSGISTVRARAHDGSLDACGFGNLGLSDVRGKLRKQDLETAEIIAQVDRKFILARMTITAESSRRSDPASILVLIDQHAADERCRVEALFEECFTPRMEGPRQIQTVTLEPIIFEIPASETLIFGRYTKFLGIWGIDYTIEKGPADRSAYVFVHTLPTLIAERCRLEPELVTNLIRGEIWRREENGRGIGKRSSSVPLNGAAGRWAEQLDTCPQGIVELLNSRACRTAIMFNDELTIEECQSLINRLARCVFPFQCAHGRPSMIPILDMTNILTWTPQEGVEYTNEEGEHSEFAEAFKTWTDKITSHSP
ncbi:hypothetical protein BDV28DRAFT_47299 [Aspergillus coremiiformis]|uniref:MutL C-terminal dimerisation domain-containing protein n=1 Tax=Aspergillus coremiiformis TaxID=138285 RepID=A0A5N6Z0B1_9EURO|nr:hypothetical protein BDV28DRAFT_47299 [Aspergillus coremiiformis]